MPRVSWALPCLVVLSVSCGFIAEAAKKETKLIIFSPAGTTSVSIDGADPIEIEAPNFVAPAVGPGPHEIEIVGGRTVQLELEAFDKRVIPVIEDQCFMSIDVTFSHYGQGEAPPPGGPKISWRRRESEPFALPSNNFLRERELPERIEVGRQALLFRSLACEEIDRLEAGLSRTR